MTEEVPRTEDAEPSDATADTEVEPSDETETEAEVEPETSEAQAPGVSRPRALRRGLAAALLVAAALFVAGAGFSGAMVQPYLADRAAIETKERVATTAAEALTTLWTYTPQDVDALPSRASKYLAGDLAEQFRGLMGSVVPESKQAQVTKQTVVVGTAVEALTDNEATVMVYTNTTNSSPLTDNIPSLSFWSYRVSLQRHGGEWLIDKMNTVTSLDLTPQL